MLSKNGPILIVALWFCFIQSVLAEQDPLGRALTSENPKIQAVMSALAEHELQVIYTQIERAAENQPQFSTSSFQLEPKHYFYPASTVKFPLALLAAEKVLQHGLTLDDPYRLADSPDQRFTIRQDLDLIFTISDNAAFNRLYELVGRDTANLRMAELGYHGFRLAHRLATENADQAHRKKIQFLNASGGVIAEFSGDDKGITSLNLIGLRKGKGFYQGGQRLDAPFSFTDKNYFSLADQHRLLRDLMFDQDGLAFSAQNRQFIKNMMARVPKQSGHDDDDFYDSYGKFFLFGDNKSPIPSHIKIYNKVGYAYGTLTDNAYIVDTKNNIEFLLSATLLVNENGVFNDDEYQYDEIGIPFLAELGRQLYKSELER